MGNKHWQPRVDKSGLWQTMLGDTLGRGLHPTYSPDFPPAVKSVRASTAPGSRRVHNTVVVGLWQVVRTAIEETRDVTKGIDE